MSVTRFKIPFRRTDPHKALEVDDYSTPYITGLDANHEVTITLEIQTDYQFQVGQLSLWAGVVFVPVCLFTLPIPSGGIPFYWPVPCTHTYVSPALTVPSQRDMATGIFAKVWSWINQPTDMSIMHYDMPVTVTVTRVDTLRSRRQAAGTANAVLTRNRSLSVPRPFPSAQKRPAPPS